jgi:MFS family permease
MSDDAKAPLPRAFWTLWSGSLVNRFGSVIQPFLALYLVGSRDVTAGTAGVVLACFGAGAVAAQPLGGWAADRYGARRTLIWGMVASAAAVTTIPFAPGLGALAACVVVFGLAVDTYRPALTALIVRLVGPDARTRAFGLVYWAVNLGTAAASLLGGVLAAHGFWLLFAINTTTCLVFALLVARLIPPERAPRGGLRDESASGAWRDGLLWGVTGVFLLFATLLVQSTVTLPLVMREQGLSTTAYGLVIAMNPLVILLVQPWVAAALGRWPLHLVYAAATLLTGVGFGLTALVDTVPGYAVAVLIWTLGEIGVATVGPVLVTGIASPGAAGRYSGIFGTAYGTASLLGPLAGTLVLAHAGQRALWLGCGVVGLAAAGAALALGPALARRQAELTVPAE